DGLAERLGVGERQLRRLFRQHLGAAPVSVAQTRRVLLAKALIHDSDLSMAEVALASGFGSVRRFNETFQALYGRPPSALRRREARADSEGVRMRLPFRPPYDFDDLLARLKARGDAVEGRRWWRDLTPETDAATGWVAVERGVGSSSGDGLSVVVALDDLKALPGVLARVRRVFDLSADPEAITRDLSADPVLKPLVEARPGLRLAGDWIDAGETAPSDRLPDDFTPSLLRRAERWRPWRAYALAHLAAAGVRLETLETRHDQAA
ncbi:MAG: helix-turn-helix domain-containing protein, partial [Brevundimonas sp.]